MTIQREVHFEPEEYAARLQRVRGAMADAGIELLVTGSPGNICYLNGYVSLNVLDIMFLGVPLEDTPVFHLWQFEHPAGEPMHHPFSIRVRSGGWSAESRPSWCPKRSTNTCGRVR